MDSSICIYESKVTESTLSGQWNDELQEHVKDCLVCRDIVAVSEGLNTLAAATEPTALPNASYIWHKAQMLARQAAEKRGKRMVSVIWAATCLIFPSALVGWMIFNRQEMQSEMGSFRAVATDLSSNAISAAPLLVCLTIALFAINSVLTVRAFRSGRKFDKK
ncbi:MAG TPA: hypothetical protein VGO50_02330 [Pyrinomonadaceae bacterium]|jgi:hypothetical protein|nr:hypothetical protein [Pyrinomonadaceae bacterium]